MTSPAQNQKQKFWFMIFRPKITNTNTNPNTITNINIEITNTDFRSAIFPFKITNQTQISDLWFSFFPFKNHKHKHKLTWLRRTEPRKKKWRMKWSEAVSRLWPWATKMRRVEDCVTVRDRRRWGRNGVERVESLCSDSVRKMRGAEDCAYAWLLSLLVGLWPCMVWACGRVC